MKLRKRKRNCVKRNCRRRRRTIPIVLHIRFQISNLFHYYDAISHLKFLYLTECVKERERERPLCATQIIFFNIPQWHLYSFLEFICVWLVYDIKCAQTYASIVHRPFSHLNRNGPVNIHIEILKEIAVNK